MRPLYAAARVAAWVLAIILLRCNKTAGQAMLALALALALRAVAQAGGFIGIPGGCEA